MLDKVKDLVECPITATKQQIKSFLGLASSYQCFTPHFCMIMAPLTDLLCSQAPQKVGWTSTHVNALGVIKEIISPLQPRL